MSEKSELKPCPFCGSPGYWSDVSDCVGCVGTCPIAGDAMTFDDWNNRPIEDAQAARIAELERTVDDLRGELAQSDRVADKARIAGLKTVLQSICKECEIKDVFSDECTKCNVKRALEGCK